MGEPAYSFTIPSIHDRTLLDSRIYLPKNFTLRGREVIQAAIVAHPYAPFGGCFDDAVVLSVTEALLREGFIVATFNFRGAGESAGSTTLTGKAEIADYESIVGFVITYCQDLLSSTQEGHGGEGDGTDKHDGDLDLVLAGYSYGSLVLARLLPVPAIASRFHDAVDDSVEGDIIRRAKRLSTETKQTFETSSASSAANEGTTSHGHRASASSVTLGDEQARRQKKRHSLHLRRGSGKHRQQVNDTPEYSGYSAKTILERYVLISPVVLPFTHSLCPPGSPSIMQSLGRATAAANHKSSYLQHPTLAIFGDTDGFTSSQRLRTWAVKQSQESSSFEWAEVEEAGHFWREEGAMEALQERVVSWCG